MPALHMSQHSSSPAQVAPQPLSSTRPGHRPTLTGGAGATAAGSSAPTQPSSTTMQDPGPRPPWVPEHVWGPGLEAAQGALDTHVLDTLTPAVRWAINQMPMASRDAAMLAQWWLARGVPEAQVVARLWHGGRQMDAMLEAQSWARAGRRPVGGELAPRGRVYAPVP